MGGGVMDVIGNVEELYATVDDIDSSDVIGSGSNSNTKENPPVPPPRHSFVEGESYDDDIAEIMAMGGDPFFMDSGENEQEEEADSSSPDGTEGDSMPTSSILSSMAGMGGDVMDVIGNVERARITTYHPETLPYTHCKSESKKASVLYIYIGVMDIIRSISATLLLLAVYTKTSAVEAKRWAFISSLPRCRHLPADNRLARQHGVPDDNIDSSDSIESGSHKKPPPPRHSFVEGESYDDDMEEIMAMGGDPSFMDSGENEQEEEADSSSPDGTEGDSMPTSSILSSMAGMGGGVMDVIGNVERDRYATDGKGPSPKNHQESSQFSAVQDDNWEWDGIVDEDAHFDFD
eukprot:CAMPEP_0195308404 /NCGR_PEP_ID=MMETSP0707-20130614/38208_1 /TAXON_ID=33640 /ORGANISM="Asterionellopsis glacialis, Strain CCMP134" /LENGTH=347 /DNA_ID=CAMNT_0040372671 /DNA_START=1 /DNA_END=1045 /DNA_ORIENTATION=-